MISLKLAKLIRSLKPMRMITEHETVYYKLQDMNKGVAMNLKDRDDRGTGTSDKSLSNISRDEFLKILDS